MSGAKNCPETPRQKMIGMMYLVLTAMLALNVSAEIIQGFNKIRHSMESSITSTKGRTEEVMKQFEFEYSKDEGGQAKYGEWWAIAQSIYRESEDFYNYIEQFKIDIARMVESKDTITVVPHNLKGGSDTNKPHQYAFNMTDPNSGVANAYELEARMDKYRTFMTEADSECIQRKMQGDSHYAHEWQMKIDMFNTVFSTDDEVSQEGETIGWAESVFHEMPASAVLALLSKYQNDVRMAENEMINFMFTSAGSSAFVVNQITAVVLPTNGEYVMQGQRYRARIVSGAVDTTNLPQVFIDGQEYADGIYEVTAMGAGQKTYSGYILMPGDTTHYEFKGQYTVGVPSAAVANLDMDIMYIGFKNRFNISVPGVSADRIKVDCPNASVSKEGNEWIIVPSSGKEVTVTVRADQDGHMAEMGQQKFRLKSLPSPDAYISFGGQTSAAEKMKKTILTSGGATVVADYGPEALIKAKFTVESFSVKFPNGQEEKCVGGKFSQKALKLIGTVRPGNMIVIRHVVAKGPDGKPRELRSLSIELQ